MIHNDISKHEVQIYGVKKDIIFEFVVIVNALKHHAKMPDEEIMDLVSMGLTDKNLLKGAKGFSGEFEAGELQKVLDKMKKEHEEENKNEKENE